MIEFSERLTVIILLKWCWCLIQFAFVIHQQLNYLLENIQYIESNAVMFLYCFNPAQQGFPFVNGVWFSCEVT